MNDLASHSTFNAFESIRKEDEIGEYWSARELSKILSYSDYRNFKDVMRKAFYAAKNSGQRGKDHFGALTTMVKIGSTASKKIDDVRLSRYACYLIVQNGDPSKEIIALGQTYFAVQTRIQEIQAMEDYSSLNSEDDRRCFLREQLTKHNKDLASAAKKGGGRC